MGAELLQTFFSRRVQPLPRQEVTMWMNLGPSCLDHPFSAELGDTEINTRIQGVLAHWANLNLSSGPVTLREGVDSPWVSLLGLAFGYLCLSMFLNVHMFLHRISGVLAAFRGGVTLPRDVVRREVNRVYSKRLWARRQRRWD
jgi:hypothetical protein